LIEIAPIFAVWPLNSCHAAQRIPQKSARYALKFVRRAVMSAPNTKWSIVSNAPKPAINVLKNAGKWQRNNNNHPLLAMQLALTACSHADGAIGKSNVPVGQNKGGVVMKGFVQNIEGITVKNKDFRQVIYTAKNCQLVVMALKPKEEIGMEVHKLDQFFRVEEGTGEAVLDGVHTKISAGFAVLVPAGTNHNIINSGSVPLKLYTIYSPPNHRDGVVHHTRAEAEADNEHFDGKTTE
jgi:mannose-6-phosphate isomerase-like protein (cupin superfamily)